MSLKHHLQTDWRMELAAAAAGAAVRVSAARTRESVATAATPARERMAVRREMEVRMNEGWHETSGRRASLARLTCVRYCGFRLCTTTRLPSGSLTTTIRQIGVSVGSKTNGTPFSRSFAT